MAVSKKGLYTLVMLGALAGCLWLFWNGSHEAGPPVCLFRRVTGLPCPSCGITHSVLFIARRQFGAAAGANILGFPVAAAMVLFPLWVVADFFLQSSSFYRFYNAAEVFVTKRWVAAALIFVVAVNWAWIIYKFAA